MTFSVMIPNKIDLYYIQVFIKKTLIEQSIYVWFIAVCHENVGTILYLNIVVIIIIIPETCHFILSYHRA